MGRQKFERVVTFLTIVLILVSSNFMQAEASPVFDANPMVDARPLFEPTPTVDLNSPSNPFIGENFNIELIFNNSGDHRWLWPLY